MTLGARLGGYLERLGQKQTAIAADWLEQWKGRGEGGRTWSDTTIGSHLSRLLNDQEQGARFFFQDRTRGALLLKVLQVPESEHAAVFELAESTLKEEGAPARVVIDATGWASSVKHADALFAELKRLLVMEGPYPIDLIILEEQYDRLPRSFDPLLNKEKLRLLLVKTHEQGWERARERAEEQGLVLSSERFPVFERWLAADFDGSTLRVEPTQGLEWFRTRGQLPSLEPVTHDLAEVVSKEEERRTILGRELACEHHRWMRTLRSEEDSARCGIDAPTRQGLARALGITATSTAKERLAAKVKALQKELPVTIQTASAQELNDHQVRARRRKVDPLALQVDDVVHLINVPRGNQLAQERPWVRVHEIPPEPTALSRLLAEVDRWSEFDFLRDSFLENLITRLDPEEKERDAFLHARAGLLLNSALQPRAAVAEAQWMPLLQELLAGDPPAAQLRVQLRNNLIRRSTSEQAPAFLVTQSRMERLHPIPTTPLQHVPPVGDTLLSRTDKPLVTLGGKSYRDHDERYSRPPVLLAKEASQARDPEFWLDTHELNSRPPPTRTDSRRAGRRWPAENGTDYSPYMEPILPWETVPLELAPAHWELADRELALAWLALRMALVNPRAIRLPDGAVLLHLGGSFFAELRITRLAQTAASSQVQGCLLLDADLQQLKRSYRPEQYLMTDEAFRISDLVTTHTVKGGYDFGARLPRRIHLLGERTCADIQFRGSALFSEASPSPLHAAAVARIDQEKQQADDDDYDDE